MLPSKGWMLQLPLKVNAHKNPIFLFLEASIFLWLRLYLYLTFA